MDLCGSVLAPSHYRICAEIWAQARIIVIPTVCNTTQSCLKSHPSAASAPPYGAKRQLPPQTVSGLPHQTRQEGARAPQEQRMGNSLLKVRPLPTARVGVAVLDSNSLPQRAYPSLRTGTGSFLSQLDVCLQAHRLDPMPPHVSW